MSKPFTISPELGSPHISNFRGYIEYDPIVRTSSGDILRGQHGVMDIKAEIARSAYANGMLNNPIIQNILK